MKNSLRGCVFIGIACFGLAACTVQPARVQQGAIPTSFAPSEEEQAYGDRVLVALGEDYPIDNGGERYEQIDRIFNELATAAAADPGDWQLVLLDAPHIADVRAVHGNYIFVWSGVFDITENEDELAGLLACEIAHSLARHTQPVQFDAASEVLFTLTDVVTSVGLMILTQGAVSISGTGMSRWAYVEASDLDPVDRIYTDEQVQDMASIALRILDNSRYSPDGLLAFWQRAATDSDLRERVLRLSRERTPQERVAILHSVAPHALSVHRGGQRAPDATVRVAQPPAPGAI